MEGSKTCGIRRRLLLRACALELRREFLDAAGGVDHALLTGVSRVGIHRHIAQHDEIVLAVDLLFAGGLHGRLREEATTSRDIEEANVVERGVAFGLHGGKLLSLARLVTRLDLVDDVNLALAANHLARRVTLLG
jgi:hypothetical protein